MGGANGLMLRYDGGAFTVMATPTTDTVFGIWGASPADVWAVGGLPSSVGFAWRLRGDAWEPEPMVPADVASGSAIWKVFGTHADDVWLVGENGVSLFYDGTTLTRGETGVGSSLFTVHANGDRYAAVGGSGNAVIVELEGDGWHNVTPSDGFIPGLSGVFLGTGDSGLAVGTYGSVYERGASGWGEVDLGIVLDQNLHGVWVDPSGGAWAVGGQTLSARLNEGILIHRPGNP
jgi:hypothetical protein